MNLKFNPRIERLKSILKILKSKQLEERDRPKYKKLALYSIEKLAGTFFTYGNREAEKILAKAMDSKDEDIKMAAFRIILQAEIMGLKLYKRTISKLKKTEEDIAIKARPAS